MPSATLIATSGSYILTGTAVSLTLGLGPGTYETIAWHFRDVDGVLTNVGAGVSVKVRRVGASSDLAASPLTTNSDGETVSGTLAGTSVDDLVNFRIENFNGMATSRTVRMT
jgi:hypothetical protein